jgi:hypothetical protein
MGSKAAKTKCAYTGECKFYETETEVSVEYISYIDSSYGKLIYVQPFSTTVNKTDNVELTKLCKRIRDLPIATYNRIQAVAFIYKYMIPILINDGYYNPNATIHTDYCNYATIHQS